MLSKPTVLMLEDDPATAPAAASLIESFGYSVTWVQNRSDALRALGKTRDAIMLDLIMPNLDGLAILEHLQSFQPHLLSRVIITTGIPDRYLDNLDRGRICGVIEKPFDPGQLERLLRHCVSRVELPCAGGEMPQRVK